MLHQGIVGCSPAQWQVVDLAQCGLSPSERFSFYDHVHTTGMDIKQPPGARAMLTMNKVGRGSAWSRSEVVEVLVIDCHQPFLLTVNHGYCEPPLIPVKRYKQTFRWKVWFNPPRPPWPSHTKKCFENELFDLIVCLSISPPSDTPC